VKRNHLNTCILNTPPRGLAALLVASLIPGCLPAQETNALNVLVVQGEGATNYVKSKTEATSLVVEIRDEKGRILPGARVTFSLPTVGPSGRFADGNQTFIAWTDSAGRATASGLAPNFQDGQFPINVTATFSDRKGSAVIHQMNSSATPPGGKVRRGRSWKTPLIVVAVAGAAALGGTLAATHGGGGRVPTVPVETAVSIGGISVGGPH
jgi:hypothetical protein